MKTFAIWFAATLTLFGFLSGAYHAYLSENPRRVLVVIDSSFPMRAVWRKAEAELRSLNGRRYTEYALISEKARIHSWSEALRLGTLSPFAPRNFANLRNSARYPEMNSAMEVHFITNAAETQTSEFSEWIVHRLR